MPTKDILWPMRGVVRREALRAMPADARGPWPCPWAVNVRAGVPIYCLASTAAQVTGAATIVTEAK